MSSREIPNHYETLGLEPGAGKKEILRARNRLLMKRHPDHNPGDPQQAKDATIKILLAAETLLDTGSRQQYDRIYRNVFGSASGGRRQGRAAGAHSQRAAAGTVIHCDRCGRPNRSGGPDYCMFCGAGIGDKPQPFSWDSVDIDSIIRNHRRREKYSFFGVRMSGSFAFRLSLILVIALFGMFLSVFAPEVVAGREGAGEIGQLVLVITGLIFASLVISILTE